MCPAIRARSADVLCCGFTRRRQRLVYVSTSPQSPFLDDARHVPVPVCQLFVLYLQTSVFVCTIVFAVVTRWPLKAIKAYLVVRDQTSDQYQ